MLTILLLLMCYDCVLNRDFDEDFDNEENTRLLSDFHSKNISMRTVSVATSP